MLKEPTCESLSSPFVYWMSLFQWWDQQGRSQQEEKMFVKNRSGVLIKFYRGQKRVPAEGSWPCLRASRNAILAEDKRCSCPSSWGHSKSHLKFQSSRDCMQYLTRWARTTWHRYRLQTSDKWCNKLCRSQAVNKSLHSKIKERNIRKYGEPHLTKILFSAIWIHCALILSNIS